MNIGLSFELLGQRAQVLKYDEAQQFYQRTGERTARGRAGSECRNSAD